MTRVMELNTDDRIVTDLCGDLLVVNAFEDEGDIYVDVEPSDRSLRWDVDKLAGAAGAEDQGWLGITPAPRYRLRYAAGAEVPIRFHHPDIGHRDGFVAGRRGHAVAWSEWRAGYRDCERCPRSG